MIRPASGFWLAVLCVAWLLVGLVGHAPWKGPDAETFASLLATREQADWLFPQSAAGTRSTPILYQWLAQASATLFSPWMPLHDGARLASGVLTGVALWLTGLAARRLYGVAAGRVAVLALLGSMGLLVPAHEINGYTAQLATTALFVYGLACMPRQPLAGGGLAGLGLAGLVLAGAWGVSLALAVALLLLPVLFPSWRTSARVGGSWFALTVLVAICGAWALAVQAHYPGRLAAALEQALSRLVLFGGAGHKYNPAYFIDALVWFAWPAWPVAGWAVYRLRREGWDSVRLWMPLGVFLVALLALSLKTGAQQLQTIVLLPPIALLASAGVGDLRRGAASALLWFSIMVFGFFALTFWVYWSALDLGVPAQLARRVARLGVATEGLRPLAAASGALLTLCWVGWLLWLKRQPRSPQRPMLVWGVGLTYVWCLLMALFLGPLDDRLSFTRMAADIQAQVGGGCVATRNLNQTQLRLLAYHTGLQLMANSSQQCRWLLAYQKGREEIPPGSEWNLRWQGARPGDRNERYWLYRREG